MKIPRPYIIRFAFTRTIAGVWTATSREQAIGRAAYDLGMMCEHFY